MTGKDIRGSRREAQGGASEAYLNILAKLGEDGLSHGNTPAMAWKTSRYFIRGVLHFASELTKGFSDFVDFLQCAIIQLQIPHAEYQIGSLGIQLTWVDSNERAKAR
ncbi:MAG: hypothetical protein P8Y71_23470 [Pseudolabrys sp.]